MRSPLVAYMRFRPYLLAVVALGLLLGAVATPAQASRISVDGGVLKVRASPGETNQLEVTLEGTELLVRDVGPEPKGGGCGARPSGLIACPAGGVTAVEISAGDGNDSVRVFAPLSLAITGGPGDDRILAGAGNDRVEGGAGSDTLEGGAGDDELAGGDGTDLLAGGMGADVLRGGLGEDDLNGEDGDDTIVGSNGSDLLNGGAGADKLLGESGDDTLEGGAGLDGIEGGPGLDTVQATDGEPDGVDCGQGSDTANVDGNDTTLNCERLIGSPALPPPPAPAPPAPASAPPRAELTPLTPFPIVRIVGAVRGSITRFSRVTVSVPRGSDIESRCAGKGCPYRRRVTTVPSRGGRVPLRGLQRGFRAGITIEVFVTRKGRIGKYARFKIRRGREPQRTDRCLRSRVMRAVSCPG